MKKLLAVDDEADILFTLEAVAEVAGYDITTVDRGLDSLNYLKKNDYDLLLIDYHMPDINGINLIKKIRKIKPKVPILVLTVDESLDLAKKFFEVGADDFANKPIKTADLISRINLHLNYNENDYSASAEINKLEIPKGMSKKTLKIVYQYLNSLNSAKTINEISAGTDLAYQTIHRYLNFLTEEKITKVELDYGKVGRPVHKYRLS